MIEYEFKFSEKKRILDRWGIGKCGRINRVWFWWSRDCLGWGIVKNKLER